MKLLRLNIVTLFLITLIACDGKQSLQEYYVDNKEDSDFIMLDVPASLISPESDKLTEEQKRVLKTVKKVNMLAYPLNESTQEKYDSENAKVRQILSDDSYEQLMTFGKPSQRMRLYFKGDEDAIDEVVVYALDEGKGFLVARVLGDDMNLSDLINFAKSMEKGDASINTSQFEGIMDVFDE